MKSKRVFSDRISTLPTTIIENILCLIPIQEAARTSILSREWRYTWTKIPKLEFDDEKFEISSDEDQLSIREESFDEPPSEWKKMSKRCKVFYAIFQVLLLHQGPITEFTLFTEADDTCFEIDQIMLHLSRKNTVKKLQLRYLHKFPLHVFSLHRLTELYLHKCHFDLKPIFNGIGSLTTLYMEGVDITKKTLIHLLSNCPSLRFLSLLAEYHNIYSDDDSGLIELFGCLCMIEHLTIHLWGIECFGGGVHPLKLPTSLVHLKYICLYEMTVISDRMYALPFLVLLIKSSPNVEKLKLSMLTTVSSPFHEREDSYTVEDYSDICLENLIELEIENFGYSEPDLEFVKLFLDKSPVLKKVMIFLNNKITNDEELEISRLFLNHPHASPVVEIVVQRCG